VLLLSFSGAFRRWSNHCVRDLCPPQQVHPPCRPPLPVRPAASSWFFPAMHEPFGPFVSVHHDSSKHSISLHPLSLSSPPALRAVLLSLLGRHLLCGSFMHFDPSESVYFDASMHSAGIPSLSLLLPSLSSPPLSLSRQLLQPASTTLCR
jgi:hypothetical protein